MLAFHSRYLRLLITKIMRAVMRPRRPGEPRVFMALNESYALGRIDYLRQQWSLVRGYGVTMISAWQSLTQMYSVWGEAEANTMSAAAGIIAAFRPADIKTAKFLSEFCGETTVVVRGYNEGQQQNAASQGSSTGLSLTQHKVPALQPQALFGMKDGQLMMISKTDLQYYITAYAPPYWQIDECNARVRANPYNPESIPQAPTFPPAGRSSSPAPVRAPGLAARLWAAWNDLA